MLFGRWLSAGLIVLHGLFRDFSNLQCRGHSNDRNNSLEIESGLLIIASVLTLQYMCFEVLSEESTVNCNVYGIN